MGRAEHTSSEHARRPSGAPVRVGLLGCGVVGAAVARVLLEQGPALEERAGAPVELAAVVVRDVGNERGVAIPQELLSLDAHAVVADPSVDIVVEVMGGLEPAGSLILDAIRHKKHVVTANKELLANSGSELMAAADDAGVDLLFEASVAGGIPVVRPLKESLAGDRVRRVMGILNGTTNFILTRMSEEDESFADALKEADRLGYTEADPSADLEGHDAAAKLAILSSLAYGAHVVAADVDREGITEVSLDDVRAAHDMGYEIKLVAVAEEVEGMVSARVHPAMLPKTHPLAAVRNEFNAVFLETDHAGELMFYGRGAGGGPTASAVVGDIMEAARSVSGAFQGPAYHHYTGRAAIRSTGEAAVRYYIVLSVVDRPGVLALVAATFAECDVSIASVRQEGFGHAAKLTLITHIATEAQHRETLRRLQHLDVVDRIESRMKVLGTDEV
ncbi:MAG: homoserine dehydrogenase [Actinomycetota bacterium]|nr:homoserine dehydrogenase [Actinomycetota bacterium]